MPAAQNGQSSSSQIIDYNYVSDGMVKTVTDALGNKTKYTYDGRDNLLSIKDPLGNLITYTYDTSNHVVLMTRTPGTGQQGREDITRYAYNANGSLSYVVTQDGGVSKYDYDGFGNLTSSVVFRDQNYNTSALTTSQVLSTGTLDSWVSGLVAGPTDLSTVMRVKYDYDTRGGLTHTTTYATCDADGNGVTATSVMDTTFDQYGNLKRAKSTGIGNAETYSYDGLGRMLTSVDLNGGTTTVDWNDPYNSCQVTAKGVTTTSTYDLMGNLLTTINSVDSTGPTYLYDKLGRLGKEIDATNRVSYFLYDPAGRLVAQVANDGAMTEYRYDANDNVIATVRYANRLTSTGPDNQMSLLQDGSGNPLNPSLDTVRPAPDSDDDFWNWRIYDADNRLVQSIDGDGYVTAFTYDDNSNLTSTTVYEDALAPSQVATFRTASGTPVAQVSMGVSPDIESLTRNYYDSEDRLIGTLDGDGGLTQNVYNRAGEITQQIAYATKVTAPLDDFYSMVGAVAGNAADQTTRYYYDGRGLLRFIVDANLQVKETLYDGAGRATTVIAYADPITLADTDTLAEVDAAVGAPVTADRQSFQIFDTTTGQLVYSIDANGDVTQYVYDSSHKGRLLHTIQFFTQRSTPSLPTQGDMDNWSGTAANNTTDDRVTRMVYNALGELAYTIDGDEYVTEYQYDAAGRKTLDIRYKDAYSTLPLDPTYTQVHGATSPDLGDAISTKFEYDLDGNLYRRTEDSGTGGYARVTQYDYNAIGQLAQLTVAAGSADQAVTTYDYDAANRLVSQSSQIDATHNAVTAYTYDAAGRVTTVKDARLKTSYYYYDAVGNLIQSKDAAGNSTYFEYDAFGNAIHTTDANGNSSYAFYDKLDRKVADIDALGYWTTYAYTIGNRLSQVTRGYAAYTHTITMGVLPTDLPITVGKDETTTYKYDELNRLTSIVDAMGFTESYHLNAFGERSSVTAKASDGNTAHGSGTTTYAYDHRGNIVTETLPIVSYTADNTIEVDEYGHSVIFNTYRYDAWGNLSQKVEAVGMKEQRTTTYYYDKLNRLTQTVGDSFTAYSGDHFQTVTTETPTTNYIYNLRDNLIETNDSAGGRSIYFYDLLSRKVAEVDKADATNNKGVLSTWSYDANGNLLTAKNFSTMITMPDPHGAAPTGSGSARVTSYSYDNVNRLKTQSVANLTYGYYADGGNYHYQTGTVTTLTNTYDAVGNLVLQVDGRGASTFSYYDADNRKISQVDGENYISEYTYDGLGNLTQEKRFARQYPDPPEIGTQPHVAPLGGSDRTTVFTYDRMGRVLTETRLGVVTATISGDTTTPATVDSQIVYTYNGRGEVLTKKEATLDYTTYTYDLGGRVINTIDSGTVAGGFTHEVTQRFDGLSNLTLKSVYALGSGQGFERTHYYYGIGGRLVDTKDGLDFEQDYRYDKAGRVTMVMYNRTHATGSPTTEAQVTQYDLLGRVVLQSIATYSTTTSTWSPGDRLQTTYNAYGQAAAHSINDVLQQKLEYDAFGRLWRETDMGVAKVFLYDQAGAVTAEIDATSSDMTGYDLRTIQLTDLVALLTNTQAGATGDQVAIGEKDILGLRITLTERDLLGQDVDTYQPFSQLSDGTSGYGTLTLTSQRYYNAFGEITKQLDENGRAIDYTYNTMGKIVKQMMPFVNWTDIDGHIYNERPTTEYYYDASGRLVGTKDANGNVNTRVLQANTGYDGSDAKVLTEYHADGGEVDNVYDSFYNIQQTTVLISGGATPVTQVTKYEHDLMNRLTKVTHPLRTGTTTQLVDYYTYDELGERLTHYNSYLTSSIRDKTDYDAQGRVVSQTDMQNQTTTYSYTWDGGISTSGLGTFGGWHKTTTNVAFKTATVHYSETEDDDTAGRIVGKTDMSGDVTSFTYNKAGLVATRTLTIPDKLDGYVPALDVYSYFNTGQIAQQVSSYSDHTWTEVMAGVAYEDFTDDTITATFSYDRLGNRLTDKETEVYSRVRQQWSDSGDGSDPWQANGDPVHTDYTMILKDSTAQYDVLSHMTQLVDKGINDADQATINISYDKNGNVRSRIANYHTLNPDGTVGSANTETDWYLYDGMNRFTLAKGTLYDPDPDHDGIGVIQAGSGTALTYDYAGRRTSATTLVSGVSNIETYAYTGDGYLSTVKIQVGSGSSLLRADYDYDAMGRQTLNEEYDSTGAFAYSVHSYYNSSSQMTEQVTEAIRTDGDWIWDAKYSYYENTNHNSTYGDSGDLYLGVLTDVHTTITKNGLAQSPTDQSYYYQWHDGALADHEYLNGNGTNFIYDVRLHLTSADIIDGSPRTLVYTLDVDGQIVARDTTGWGVHNAPHERYTIFNGVQMGDVSNDGTSDTDYATSINRNTATSLGGGLYQNGGSSPVNYSDFDGAYDPINGLDPASDISYYTVQSGDTLQSIAQQLWGDANLWYVLAGQNGLSADSTLPAGSDLIVPGNVYGTSNNAGTYRVYDPNRALGNTAPTHPPKPTHSGCGVFGMILLAVIAVAVAVISAGAMVAALAPVGSSMTVGAGIGAIVDGTAAGILGGGVAGAMEMVGIGAVAGAAGSIVSQGVGLATGMQKSFNWGAVGMAAIGGAVGMGMGPNGLNAFGGIGNPMVGAILNGAASNALTQGIGVATGLQKGFNWADVAAAGISAGVMQWGAGALKAHFPDMSAGMLRFADGMAGDAAHSAVRSLINGSDFGDNMLQGLPSILGQAIGNGITGDFDGPSDPYAGRLPPHNQFAGPGATPPQL